MKKNIPILIVFFNRPDFVIRLLESLSEFKPSKLYLACDGPRLGNIDDILKVKRCKEVIETNLTWKSELNFLYSDKNHGCDEFVPSAINWLFTKEDKAIILEDDCIINEEFYKFSSLLLTRYAEDSKVMNISAGNFQEKKWGSADYYFSRYPSNWGWATWRRAWQKYDPHMTGLDAFLNRDNRLNFILDQPGERKYWARFFKGLYSGKYTYWDAKWLYSIWKNDGFSITPNVNLVCNIGFGIDATHTKFKDVGMNMEIGNINHPIIHPNFSATACQEADTYIFKTRYKPKLLNRAISFISRLLN